MRPKHLHTSLVVSLPMALSSRSVRSSGFSESHAGDRPRAAAVYNLGGGRQSNCSMLEAIEITERVVGRPLEWSLADENRIGDHRWWVSDLSDFQRKYPGREITRGIDDLIEEIYAENADRWSAEVG